MKGPDLLPNLPPMTEPNQQIIGSYIVTKTLGRGTFGKVKEGIHIFTMQKVAIKILVKSKIHEVTDMERVARELHILKLVRHPNIIQLYEIIETQTKLFIIMEHCCNGELFSYITSKTKLKEEEACRLYQQLIMAINYLSELGIVHRDVKPENLLLDRDMNLKMVDFGLSNTYEEGEKLSTACGSPCYAAPELIKGFEYSGQKADLWSSGVVLYTLLSGHLPFEDSNTQALYQKILHARYKFTCYLTTEVQDLIRNILVPDPQMRYGLKQIMQNVWFRNKHPFELKKSIAAGDEVLNPTVLAQIKKDQLNVIDIQHLKRCIQANQHNCITSYYFLLLKKLSTSDKIEVVNNQRKYQSIEPIRTTIDEVVIQPLVKQEANVQLKKVVNDLTLIAQQDQLISPNVIFTRNTKRPFMTMQTSTESAPIQIESGDYNMAATTTARKQNQFKIAPQVKLKNVNFKTNFPGIKQSQTRILIVPQSKRGRSQIGQYTSVTINEKARKTSATVLLSPKPFEDLHATGETGGSDIKKKDFEVIYSRKPQLASITQRNARAATSLGQSPINLTYFKRTQRPVLQSTRIDQGGTGSLQQYQPEIQNAEDLKKMFRAKKHIIM